MNYVEELLPEAMIEAQGCPEPLIVRHLRTAMVEFYRESKAWRYTTEPASVTVGERAVELDLPTGTAVLRVYWAKLAGKVLQAVSPRNLREVIARPTGYAINGITRVVYLDSMPDQNYILDGVEANVALLPLRSLEELPDELFDQHRDGILYGALAKLLMMRNVPWSDPQGAMNYQAMANGQMLQAQRQADSQQAPVTRVVKYGGI